MKEILTQSAKPSRQWLSRLAAVRFCGILPQIFLLLTASSCLTSCATHTATTFRVVAQPLPQPAVAAAVRAVFAPVGKVAASNRSIDSQITSLQREAATARTEAQAASYEAERLAKIGTATKDELDHQAKAMKGLEAHAEFQERETARLGKTVAEQRGQIADLTDAAQAANVAASLKDSQVAELTARLDEANTNGKAASDALSKQVDSERKKKEEAETKLATAGVYRRWVLTGACILGGLSIIAALLWAFIRLWPLIRRAVLPV